MFVCILNDVDFGKHLVNSITQSSILIRKLKYTIKSVYNLAFIKKYLFAMHFKTDACKRVTTSLLEANIVLKTMSVILNKNSI